MSAHNFSRRDFLKGAAASAVGFAAMGLMSGCGTTAAPTAAPTGAAGLYTPGTYTATATGMGSVTVTMTFDANSITDVQLDLAGETDTIGQAAGPALIEQLMSAQSSEIDGVSGATVTTGAVKKAAADCIAQAQGVSSTAPSTAATGYTLEELTAGSGTLVLNAGNIVALGTGPKIDESKIVEVINCDVCVCGAGITGLAAARAASEEGAKVVVLEKNAAIEVHGFQCGVVNSSIQKNLGAEVDPKEILNEYQRRTVGRANMKLASLWANHSGEVFDWWYDAVDDKPADMVENVTLAYYPLCPEHDPKAGMCKTFLGSIDLKEDRSNPLGSKYWIAIGTANQQKAIDNGADFRFSTPAVKLITDADGNVTGVYGKDADGNLYQVNTAKGVILTTGGLCMFGAGSEVMHKVFAPTLYKNSVTINGTEPAWSPMFTPDMGPISGDTGDGQLIGVWAGAKMDPYGDCAMGSAESGIGGTVALCVNQEGRRFWNEDMGIWEKHDALMYQPGRISYDIIDVNWRDRLPYQELGHRNFQVIDGYVGMGWKGKDYINQFHEEFLTSVGNPEGIVPTLDPHAGVVYGANTLEELADIIGVPKDTFLATVARYNDICKAKEDPDFGCDPQKLFPVSTAPFFACSATAAPAMAAYAGLVVNGDLQVLNNDGSLIGGLYAAGSCAGGKFSPSYSTLLSGMNHGQGITHGYFAGKSAVLGTVDL